MNLLIIYYNVFNNIIKNLPSKAHKVLYIFASFAYPTYVFITSFLKNKLTCLHDVCLKVLNIDYIHYDIALAVSINP